MYFALMRWCKTLVVNWAKVVCGLFSLEGDSRRKEEGLDVSQEKCEIFCNLQNCS
jgi:hypothetical protein